MMIFRMDTISCDDGPDRIYFCKIQFSYFRGSDEISRRILVSMFDDVDEIELQLCCPTGPEFPTGMTPNGQHIL
jgi:hypothetical protein